MLGESEESLEQRKKAGVDSSECNSETESGCDTDNIVSSMLITVIQAAVI